MTTAEIAAEHGVSRQSIHAYRRTGTFPQPVEDEGSTRPRFRADEVAAFFEANPKQPGKKRSSLSQQGDAPVIDGQVGSQPLNGNDARAILRIVWQWIEDANDGLGSDVGDLQHGLESAGYGPPPEVTG
ncbi:helix-turn-helix transcriptional regulator [Wenjunlia vitaminophila]|uniref:helix-turn-helix transcriptional regulator n=1 Tax=Wenjunlia vitaminophila TaxID=76728 RepID=UPI00036D36A8|nr:helix-turn-helix domain-containing protein [Wenjunlia vitaminophila]